MGISPLPTAAQRLTEKSGKALQRIQDETQKGSFHFVDNYERMLMHIGRIIDDLLPKIIDSPRDEVITKEDKTHHTIRVGEPTIGPNGKQETYDFSVGDHDVTISTGPSFQSEREQADDFVDTFFGNIATLPIDPPVKAQLTAMAIKLKDLGPIGDQMAEAIYPSKNTEMPPAAQSMISKMQQELQLAQTTIAQLMQEKTHEMAKNQTILDKAQADNLTKIAIAEIQTKAQAASERAETFNEAQQLIHQSAHEVGMSQLEHAQTLQQQDQMGQQQQQNAAQQAALNPPEPQTSS
jgi:hypothetical protein